MPYRGEMEIIGAILMVAEENPDKGVTQICTWAGINYIQTTRYIPRLVQAHLIELRMVQQKGAWSRKEIVVTPRGRDFLKKLNEIKAMLQPQSEVVITQSAR